MRLAERFSLSGKTAIVTGATGLLGRHYCRALAEAGAAVVATDLDSEICAELAREIGGSTLAMAADIRDPQAVRKLADEALSHTGQIDILVNNAAINDHFDSSPSGLATSRFENYPLELWQRSLEVNVTGAFLCCQVIGGEMADAGRGSIINIASTYGIVAPDQSLYRDRDGSQRFYKSPAYSTTKGAVLALTRFLAAYWGRNGVRVNALSPGGVENGQDDFFVREYADRTPLGRMAAPGDLVGALTFLASDASAYMTGANLVVDGGFTVW